MESKQQIAGISTFYLEHKEFEGQFDKIYKYVW